jgi:hypothetical protein
MAAATFFADIVPAVRPPARTVTTLPIGLLYLDFVEYIE